MLPPLLYVCAFIMLYVIFVRGQALARLLLSYLSAVALPWVYVSVWYGFFVEDGTFRQFLADYGGGLVPSLPELSGMDLQTAIYLSLLAVIGIRAVVNEKRVRSFCGLVRIHAHSGVAVRGKSSSVFHHSGCCAVLVRRF